MFIPRWQEEDYAFNSEMVTITCSCVKSKCNVLVSDLECIPFCKCRRLCNENQKTAIKLCTVIPIYSGHPI
jgi:hypothetical protein